MNESVWEAIISCDAAYDGQFYYGVATTGIFCRPSCKSRNPKRENVRIFTEIEQALSAQFRPCKRCRPDHLQLPDVDLSAHVISIIESRYQEPLTLQVLAEQLHVSPSHLHRVFKKNTGTTPAHYLQRIRIDAAKQRLTTTETPITEIALSVGFSNAAHFSTVFQKATGKTPTEYRQRHVKPAH